MSVADDIQSGAQVKLNDAKSTLMTASKFKAEKPAPTYEAPPDTVPGTTDPAAKAELDRVSDRVQIPKMHKGGTVKAEGVYHLKAGEHVLTAKEAEQLKKSHGKAKTVLSMTSGLKSLQRSGPMAPVAPPPEEPAAPPAGPMAGAPPPPPPSPKPKVASKSAIRVNKK